MPAPLITSPNDDPFGFGGGMDGEGHLVWTSKTYWSNTSVLDEAATLMRSLNEAVA